MSQQPETIEVRWAEGDRFVRWTCGSAIVEKRFAEPPQSVVAWDGHVLVVEAMPSAEARKDNAVVFDADGTERVRLKAPRTGGEPHWVIGYYTAYLDGAGPVVVVATQVGDVWGRIDLDAGTLTDVRPWR
ncbi:hypothetical protein DMB38_29400 [Streptomyces sp. WAC 06738]|uniref:hypothetical protein n=1 Tax=Streptomyces sp. WAC 06738 TaxID=2203210 RepID=UPI000F6E138A|nr:hypothetical protein [Streptomyces sp. WAC 06738]AZM49356.1 hypothetical protein DMB38_29400 [Streptomyces sp. WAC 06738]